MLMIPLKCISLYQNIYDVGINRNLTFDKVSHHCATCVEYLKKIIILTTGKSFLKCFKNVKGIHHKPIPS